MYKWTHCKEHFSVQELGRILLTNTVPQEKLCSIQPTKVCHNTTFVVDLHALDDIDDIRADENGVWIRKGSPIAFVSVHDNGHDGKVKVVRRSRMGSHLHYYKRSLTVCKNGGGRPHHLSDIGVYLCIQGPTILRLRRACPRTEVLNICKAENVPLIVQDEEHMHKCILSVRDPSPFLSI